MGRGGVGGRGLAAVGIALLAFGYLGTSTAFAAVAPTITSIPEAYFPDDVATSFTVTTTGTLPMTITETGFLPTGITFVDNGNGTATLSGTVASSATLEGDWPITITASNGTAPDASQQFTIHVTCVAITSANNTTFYEGENGTFPVNGTTACHGTIVWASVSPGAPPAGVFLTDNLNGTATLSGTPGPGTAGVWHFTIQGVDGDPPSNRQSFTLTVGPPLVVASHSFNATEGTLTIGQVASFSGGNGPYSATIAWGDGTTSGGTITGNNINGSHTFAEEGPTNITVSVTDAGTTASSTIAQTIGDAALFSTDLGSVPIAANEGAVFSGQVMGFDDTDPGKTASDYTASIAWGDGTISAGTVVAVGAGFGVTGSHAYAEHGTYNGITTVTDHASTASSSLTATIAELSPLVVSGNNITATAGVSFSGQVGTVTDNGNKEAISDYVVIIDWGDGTTATTATLTDPPGVLRVDGTHTYATVGTFTVTISARESDVALFATGTGTATVAGALPTSLAPNRSLPVGLLVAIAVLLSAGAGTFAAKRRRAN
jgi:hypothetical protein